MTAPKVDTIRKWCDTGLAIEILRDRGILTPAEADEFHDRERVVRAFNTAKAYGTLPSLGYISSDRLRERANDLWETDGEWSTPTDLWMNPDALDPTTVARECLVKFNVSPFVRDSHGYIDAIREFRIRMQGTAYSGLKEAKDAIDRVRAERISTTTKETDNE